jgi:hypothetical protein
MGVGMLAASELAVTMKRARHVSITPRQTAILQLRRLERTMNLQARQVALQERADTPAATLACGLRAIVLDAV